MGNRGFLPGLLADACQDCLPALGRGYRHWKTNVQKTRWNLATGLRKRKEKGGARSEALLPVAGFSFYDYHSSIQYLRLPIRTLVWPLKVDKGMSHLGGNLVTRIPGLYTASGVLPHALFLSLSLRGGEEGSKSAKRANKPRWWLRVGDFSLCIFGCKINV